MRYQRLWEGALILLAIPPLVIGVVSVWEGAFHPSYDSGPFFALVFGGSCFAFAALLIGFVLWVEIRNR